MATFNLPWAVPRQFSRTQVGLLLALLLSNAIVLSTSLDWSGLRLPAALLLTFVLPGWAWLSALDWLQTSNAVERFVLVIGFSSLLSALALFITLRLPGPFTETPTLITLNIATLTGLLYQLIFNPKSKIQNPKSKIDWPSRSVLLILLAILAVAAITRLTRLGYSEFHEDELENMRLIIRAYQGEEYAPFLDSKGPIHWLLPAALWYLHGWLNEGIARLPFVLASLLLIPMIYVLGQRMSGGRASVGLLAAGFVAVNGFFVALARHVENRSLIVFWGALAMWLTYRYYRERHPQFLFYLALTLAVGLIAHPSVLLYLPVFGYLLWLAVRSDGSTERPWLWLIGAASLFIILSALFYVPYLADPEINLVYEYFAGDQIGTSLLYNRVYMVFDEDNLYSSRYHAPVLVILMAWFMARHFAQWRWRGWVLLSVATVAMISTVTHPDLWVIAGLNLAFIPFALIALAFILLPQLTPEIRAIFLWFSLPLGALIFLARDVSNHIQIAYPAWALLSALALVDLWACLSKIGERGPMVGGGLNQANRLWSAVSTLARAMIILALVLIVPLILVYQYLSFDSTVTAYWEAKADSERNPDSIYNFLYGSVPRPRKIISNPRLGGWKAVGYLWDRNTLSGDFRSIDESFAVPIWYTFQTPRSCYDDPQHYWVRRDWDGWPDEEQDLIEHGYTLTRIVRVDGDPKLHLYEKNAAPREPEILDMEDYRGAFDRLATPASFVQDETPEQHTSFNFGGKLLLRGYDLPQKTMQAGDLLLVTAYWESLSPMDIRYRGFVHLVGAGETRWGQHDDDPACRLLTTDMRPGQRSSRQFRLPIDPATPPGDYQVILGLYHPDTLERLEIWDNLTGQAVGNSIVLGQVRVGENKN